MDSAPFDIGEPVVDREQDDPNTAIIVNCPPKTATDWIAYRETTVAEDNPDYPDDALIAVAVYRDELAEFDPDWADRDKPFSLAEFNEAGTSHYSFPAPRLKSLTSEARSDDDTTDTDAENETGEQTVEEASTDDTSTAPTEDETNTDGTGETESEPAPDPPAAVRDLKETLADRGLAAEIEANGQTVAAEKLGVTYRVQPGEVLDGDGPHREKIEQIVAEP
jgi:hypothetical protein